MIRTKVILDSETPKFVFHGVRWAPCKLFGLTVLEMNSAKAIWRIVSDGERIESIRYGEVPVGFRELLPAQRLSAAAAYQVRIDGGEGCALADSSQFKLQAAR